MAAAFATSSTVVGLCSSSLSSPSRISLHRRVCHHRAAGANGAKFTCRFKRDWLRTDLNVTGFGFIGWLAPSSIPAINGKSLTGLFLESIGAELARFPTPPAITFQFWLWLITWHLGLFLCLAFGQIGFKGRTEEYF